MNTFKAITRKNKSNHYHKAYTLIDDSGAHTGIISLDVLTTMITAGLISSVDNQSIEQHYIDLENQIDLDCACLTSPCSCPDYVDVEVKQLVF